MSIDFSDTIELLEHIQLILNRSFKIEKIMKNMKNIPKPPKRPMTRIIREGSTSFCPYCHSSIQKSFFGKKLGCIQPECKNYYK